MKVSTRTLWIIAGIAWIVAAIVACSELRVQDKPVHHYPPIESPLHNNLKGEYDAK